jgi:hypothetical protein
MSQIIDLLTVTLVENVTHPETRVVIAHVGQRLLDVVAVLRDAGADIIPCNVGGINIDALYS